jgi:signal transduction histidine kinase
MRRPLVYLRLTFLVSVVLLVVLTVWAFLQIRSLIVTSNEVDHTHEVLLKAEQILSIVKDAETGQRGYLLTKRREFLQPYTDAVRRIDRQLNDMRVLVKDNGEQLQYTDTLRVLTSRRLEIMNRVILQDSLGRLARSDERIAILLEGKSVMDRMRQTIRKILAHENELMKSRQESKMISERGTPKYILVLSGITLLLLTLSFLLVNRELRQRLQTQQVLEQKVAALNRSNAELEQFAYVASHDLQEPLRKIRAFGDRLQLRHREQLSDEGQTLLEKIERSAGRMQVLIDDLLNFSRLVNQKGEMQWVDLGQVWKDVVQEQREVIKDKKAVIHQQGTLPTLQVYPTQIRQLFQNLLTNALKFAKDHETPQVWVSTDTVTGEEARRQVPEARLPSYYRIVFRDNGIGFESEYAEKIFVIFQRLHTKSQFGGTGIGLAVCKRVVANHYGYIVAESQPGQGATFSVFLPPLRQNTDL